MSVMLCDDEEEPRLTGGRGPIRPKPRFSVNEVRVLLQAVRKNRYVILKRFNQGVSVELKKQTWADITNQVNELGENYREVRQIMKKWADLKCDGKRRMASMRGPNGSHLRKKTLGPVEMMVHKILTMNPDGEDTWDVDFEEEEDFYKLYHSNTYSYINNTEKKFPKGAAFDLSPQSEQSKDPQHSSSDIEPFDDGDYNMDLEDEDSFSLPLPSSSADVVPDRGLLRIRPLLTYSRNTQNQIQNQTQIQTTSEDQQGFSKPPSGPPSPPVASTSEAASSSSSSQAPPPPPPPEPEPLPALPALPKQAPPPPLPAPPSEQPSTSAQSDPLPVGCGGAPSQLVVQMASQSMAQQVASRALLSSVSQSLETLAQSVQLLVEGQTEFVQESLLLQRETLDILKDFSSTALAMLRGGGASAMMATRQNPNF
ncbi:actin cytoskeleton-regulatory complex protein PAN1 isoform X2 [Gouania willdenowi]|uniref:Actin cytoskeleton-regulatory complex protein PAN1-like n=1 Tax=Gouania willdenowi TaxID=441366 RepID=A0A8C5DW05_GOUWI|nr:actin cytoskeleton-regulatory complex protein PAN1-like isoform X2 [Gouania willdenowi]